VTSGSEHGRSSSPTSGRRVATASACGLCLAALAGLVLIASGPNGSVVELGSAATIAPRDPPLGNAASWSEPERPNGADSTGRAGANESSSPADLNSDVTTPDRGASESLRPDPPSARRRLPQPPPPELVLRLARGESGAFLPGEPVDLVLEFATNRQQAAQQEQPLLSHLRLMTRLRQGEWALVLAEYADGMALLGPKPIRVDQFTSFFRVQPLTASQFAQAVTAEKPQVLSLRFLARFGHGQPQSTGLFSNTVSVQVRPIPPQDEAAAAMLAAQEGWSLSWPGRLTLRTRQRRPGDYVRWLDAFLAEHGRSTYAPHVMLERAVVQAHPPSSNEPLDARERYALLERVTIDFPYFERMPEVLCWMGVVSLLKTSGPLFDPGRGEQLLQRVAREYPESAWAARAREELRRVGEGYYFDD